jgi:hypothetical protein
MKKSAFLLLLASLLLAFTFTGFSYAYTDAYPSSPSLGIPLPTDGEILKGEMIGTLGWGDSEEVDYRGAWDGNIDTIFDPLGVGGDNFTGVKLDDLYILTEVRIHPRTTFLDRFEGATIQGSNDGTTWTDLFVSPAAALEVAFQIITADQLTENVGYSYYRYYNQTVHGDVAEVELYGKLLNPPVVEVEEVVTEAAVETNAPETTAPAVEQPAAPTTSPETGDNGILFAILLAGISFASIMLVKRKAVKI